MLSRALGFLFHLYNLLILIRIFLSWVPNFDWEQQPFAWIRSIVDPLLNIFRGIIPPIGMIDFSPVIAIIILQILGGYILGTLSGLGL